MKEVLEMNEETGIWRKVRIDGVIYWRFKCSRCGLTAVTMREQLYQGKLCPRCHDAEEQP